MPRKTAPSSTRPTPPSNAARDGSWPATIGALVQIEQEGSAFLPAYVDPAQVVAIVGGSETSCTVFTNGGSGVQVSQSVADVGAILWPVS